jgi:hypothetical protein
VNFGFEMAGTRRSGFLDKCLDRRASDACSAMRRLDEQLSDAPTAITDTD